MKLEHKESEFDPKLFRKLVVVFVPIGIAFIVLITLITMFLRNGRIDAVENQVRLLEAKLKQEENKLNRLGEIDDKLADIDEKLRFLFSKYKQVEILQQRPESLEKSGTRRTDKISAEEAKLRYHQVRAGETLYGISSRYGF